MPMMRVKSFTTNLTAGGTAAGLLVMADTSGITRNSVLNIDHATGGFRVQVERVLDSKQLLAAITDFTAESGNGPGVWNRRNLSAIPNGATVILEEQWVQDLYAEDAPMSLAIPTK